jgi:RNA polymerase sigma factor (sigma-70 family)
MQATQASTKTLVRRGRMGDQFALDRLFSRLMGALRRWAHGRLPTRARDLGDTVDVVQDAALGVWRRLDHLELETTGDLEAYVREAVRNRIRDEARRLQRRPDPVALDSRMPDGLPSPLEQAANQQAWKQYQVTFSQLREDEREAIVARFELGYTYDEVAALLRKPSAAAARMTVNRALDRLKVLAGDAKS